VAFAGGAEHLDVSFQQVVRSAPTGAAEVAETLANLGVRMDIHKNARLTPHNRAELVRRVLRACKQCFGGGREQPRTEVAAREVIARAADTREFRRQIACDDEQLGSDRAQAGWVTLCPTAPPR